MASELTVGDCKVNSSEGSGSYGFVHTNSSGVKVVTDSNSTIGFVGTATNHSLKLLANNDGKVEIATSGLATFSSGINVSAGDLGVGTTNPDAGTNAPTSRSSVGKLNTYTGNTASIANSATLDIPLTMPKGLMAYIVESNYNTGHMSAGLFRANNDGANSAYTFFGQSEYGVAVTYPSGGNIRIANNTGADTTFFYAITVIAG
jgi:hypothetical protein